MMIKNSKLWSKNIVVKCILSIIILSLILSTVSSYMMYNTKKYIATVNGEKISLYTLQKIYDTERKKQQQILGKKFIEIQDNKEFIKETYNYILSQLINNILLEQYAKKLKLTITDQEIKKIILNASIFQENKIFNKKKYFNYLSSIELRNQEYINIIKKRLITEKLINTINDTNFMLNNEKKNIIRLLSEERVIQKAIIATAPLISKQHVSDEEVKNYFFQHRDSFYIPEQFQISYIKFKPNHFKTECSNEEIQKWYNDHINDYVTETKKEYSIIQTKNKEEALSILSQLHNAESFFEIAKKKSIDPISSIHGGNIGWITNSATPNIIKKANLKHKNQISEIIPFHDNFLIIKLNNIVAGHKKELSEESDSIKQQIQYIKSLKRYNTVKNQIKDFINQHPNRYDLLIKEIKIKPIETDWFTEKSIPKIFDSFIFKKIIFNTNFSQKQNQLKSHSGLINFKNHTSFIISIKNHREKENKTFNAAKKEIIHIIKNFKAVKNAKEKAEKIVLQLKKDNQDLLIQSHLFFNPSEIISRYDKNFIVPIVFSLPHPQKNKKIYTTFQDENNNIVILFFSKIRHKNFSLEEEKIITKYLDNNNTETIFNSILKNLHEKAHIQYNKIEGI